MGLMNFNFFRASTMNYNQYIKDATRTESLIDSVETNEQGLKDALQLFILSGQILDLYKRQVFYKKDFENSQIQPLLDEIHKISTLQKPDRSKQTVDTNARILHASMGFATEAGEIMEALIEGLNGKDLDKVNFWEEIGDINWYTAIALDETGGSLDDICAKNISKLKARFPDKFSEHHAIERNLNKERDILEGN
jgi:NTP pyrophosphatase (non-canonical NTP hydrolase)